MRAPPELLPAGLPVELWRALVAKVKPGDAGKSASTMLVTPTGATTVVAAVLPAHCSRHNRQSTPRNTALVSAAADAAEDGAAIVLVLKDQAHAAGAARMRVPSLSTR